MPMVKPCLGFNSPLGNKQKSKPKTSKFSIKIKLSNNFAIITTPSSCNLFSSDKKKEKKKPTISLNQMIFGVMFPTLLSALYALGILAQSN